MPRFTIGLMLGLAFGILFATGNQPDGTITTRIIRERTTPTTVVFWHFPEAGGLCSASLDTPMGQMLARWENAESDSRKKLLTFKLFELDTINR